MHIVLDPSLSSCAAELLQGSKLQKMSHKNWKNLCWTLKTRKERWIRKKRLIYFRMRRKENRSRVVKTDT